MMKTKAVRLYGKQDLRFEEVILPEIDDDGVQVGDGVAVQPAHFYNGALGEAEKYLISHAKPIE